MSTANPPARRRALASLGNSLSLEPPERRIPVGQQKRQTLLPSCTRPAPVEHPTAHPATQKAPIPLKPRVTRVPTAPNPLVHPAAVRTSGGPARNAPPNRQQDGTDARALENRTGALKPEWIAPRGPVQRSRGAPYTTTHSARTSVRHSPPRTSVRHSPPRTSARRRSPPHRAALPLPPSLREQRPVDRALAARDMWPAGPATARRTQGDAGRLSVGPQLPTPPPSMRVRGPGARALLADPSASRPVLLSPPPSQRVATSLVSLMRSLSGRRNGARGAGSGDGQHAEGAGGSFTMELDETDTEPLLGLTLAGLGAPAHPASPDVDPDFTPLAMERGKGWSAGEWKTARRVEAVGRGGGESFVARDEVERAMGRVCEACMRLCREWEALEAVLGRAGMA